MLIAENMAALVVFVLWVAAFAMGYAMRNRIDGGRAEWADTFAYRQRSARTRARYRRATDGRD